MSGGGSRRALTSASEPRRRDVFLGGSCGLSRWRDEIAVPILLLVLSTCHILSASCHSVFCDDDDDDEDNDDDDVSSLHLSCFLNFLPFIVFCVLFIFCSAVVAFRFGCGQ